MSELISPLRFQDNLAVFEGLLQTHQRKAGAVRQADALPSPDVKMQVQPIPKMLNEAEATSTMNQIQAEAQHGMGLASVHSGLDPQRVAKLLSSLGEV